MESYKKKIRIRMALFCLLPLSGLGIALYWHLFGDAIPQYAALFGFQTGMLTTLGICGIAGVIRYAAILRDEKKLRREYNRENDERIRAIQAKAGLPFSLIAAIAMIVAGIGAGYFNFTVFCTLIIAATVQLLAICLIKLIYAKKM